MDSFVPLIFWYDDIETARKVAKKAVRNKTDRYEDCDFPEGGGVGVWKDDILVEKHIVRKQKIES